ncbi:MAG TPA: ATP-dependent DNA helicase [Vicinamibacterales bacterium]|nr:ATP-dependent DNA helicase [Vicinamibacterales bacterium]
MRTAVEAAFADDGALARVIPGYESRQGQRAMASAVADVIEHGGTLVAEAGTGTGKTLAYLVPAILSGQRVLVSTGTKNLQEQIFFKDLPTLRDALGKPFSATLMKGRSNYLCLHRFETYRDGVEGNTSVLRHGSGQAASRLIESGDRVLLPIVDAWAKTTKTGDRAELRELPEDLPLWKDIAADAETCLGSECPRYGDCFVTLMRQRAAESDVVIVNHHLLCADAQLRKSAYGEVIPTCATLVVDEAHQLEDVATQYFGIAVSNYRIEDLVRDVDLQLSSFVGRGFTARQTEDVTQATSRVTERSRTFFSALSMARMEAAESKARYTSETFIDYFQDGAMLAGALEGLEATLVLAGRKAPPHERGERGEISDGRAGPFGPAETDEVVATLARRARELHQELSFLIRASDDDFVYYVESRGRGFFLRASPIDVSRLAKEALFDRMRTTVLTSATLAVEGSFEYFKSRLGIHEANQVRVPSEFDYARQALLYLPRRVPSPKSPAFSAAAAREVIEILKRTRGRAFVLFTSYAMLRSVQPLVEMSLPFPILVQGTAPRSTLLEQFRSTPNAVLLATSSFWQGVDVVGEALSCVIVDKLPFASPGDPITAARIESIRASGGDAFADYQVPLAILALQQGLGRLIRHRSDRGVLAVLDPRLRTMGYGRRFLDSLPPAPVTHDLAAVERFFG